MWRRQRQCSSERLIRQLERALERLQRLERMLRGPRRLKGAVIGLCVWARFLLGHCKSAHQRRHVWVGRFALAGRAFRRLFRLEAHEFRRFTHARLVGEEMSTSGVQMNGTRYGSRYFLINSRSVLTKVASLHCAVPVEN